MASDISEFTKRWTDAMRLLNSFLYFDPRGTFPCVLCERTTTLYHPQSKLHVCGTCGFSMGEQEFLERTQGMTEEEVPYDREAVKAAYAKKLEEAVHGRSL